MDNLKAGIRRRIGLCCVMLFFLPSVGVMGNSVFLDDGQQSGVAKKIKRSPDVSLAVDNSESPGVSIQTAGAKEITGLEYAQITGHDSEQLTRSLSASARYTSCPTITVTNATNRTVKAFALGLINKQSNSLDILRIGDHPLAPSEEFVVKPAEWAKARKKTTKTFVHDGGVSREDESLPGWSSEEMWFPGNTTDFYIFVGEVEFSDGSRWFTKRDK
jgi:hypothetical protein